MKRILGKISISLGAVLVCLALLLLVNNQREDQAAGEVSGEILEEMKGMLEETESTVSDLVDAETGHLSEEMKTVKIDGYEYIGYLSIPALGLELPVMSDWSYEKLRTAPCREVGAVNTRDLVIAAHNYDRHFGRLKQLVPGDMVMFTDMNDITTVYRVELLEELAAGQVKEMRAEGWDMTLYTCTYSGRTRVTVRCRMTR